MKINLKNFSIVFIVLALLTSGSVLADNSRLLPEDGSNSTGTITVIHGVPGLTVDIYVNGELTLSNFEPETITDPMELPSGSYDIIIVPAGGDPNNPTISGSAIVAEGLNASIVAHLSEAGEPTLSTYENDISPIMDDFSRLVVRHTAAAPAVDVALYDDDDVESKDLVGVVENLSNPNEAQLDIPEDKYYATIAPAGSDTTVFGPANLDLEDKMAYFVYAVGSLSDGSFTLLVQTIELEELQGSKITVVHGIPSIIVDVYVNGELALSSFEPGTVTDPLDLPSGDYDITIVAAGGDPGNPILSSSVTVTEGLNASIVAHLNEAGEPMLSVFVNDDSPIVDDTSRLVVRHLAAAPAVDVALFDNEDLQEEDLVAKIEGLTNPNEVQTELVEGDYYVTISPSGSEIPVYGPEEFELEDETAYIVYAVGSLTDNSFMLLLQTIELEEVETGMVTVVHGIPGLTVDVYVNGELTLPGFESGTITDPIELPVGNYDIIIVPTGGDPASPAIAGSVTVAEGVNGSIVAHLSEVGDPILSLFVNDDSPILDDTSRLVVRHTAAAPAVDVALYDDDDLKDEDLVGVIENLENPNEAQVEVPDDDYFATISPAGSNVNVFGPVELELDDEMSYIVYAVGSLADNSFTLLVQTIELDELDD